MRHGIVLLLVALSGCAGEPSQTAQLGGRLEVAPAELDFGAVVLERSRVLPLRVRNASATAASLVLPAEAGAFTVEAETDEPLQPGGEATLLVRFVPGAARDYEDTLVLALESAALDAARVHVRGSGTERAIETESRLDFGAVEVGAEARLELPITSTALVPIEVVASFEGQDASSFSLGPGAIALPPGATGAVEVRFAPRLAGAASARLLLRPCASCAPVEVRLRGEGDVVNVGVSPARLDFGTVSPGTLVERELRVTSLGDVPTWLTGVSAVVEPGGPFAVAVPPLPVRIEGSFVDVAVAYAPSVEGEDRGVVRVELDGRTFEVELVGLASSSPLRATPAAIDFGLVPAGTAGARTLELRDLGAGPAITVASYVTEGDARFSATAGRALPAEARSEPLSFEVAFASSPGAATGQLVLRGEGLRQAIGLAAEGVEGGACDLRLDRAAIDFGLVRPGRVVERALRITNLASSACTVGRFAVEGTAFGIVGGPPSNVLLEGGGTLELVVSYEPASTGIEREVGAVRFLGAGIAAPFEVPLSGLGGTSELLADVWPVVFPDTAVASRTSLVLELRAESAPVSLVHQELEGDAFAIVSPAASELSAGATTSLELSFAPQAAGAHRGELLLWPADSLEPIRIPVEGDAR